MTDDGIINRLQRRISRVEEEVNRLQERNDRLETILREQTDLSLDEIESDEPDTHSEASSDHPDESTAQSDEEGGFRPKEEIFTSNPLPRRGRWDSVHGLIEVKCRSGLPTTAGQAVFSAGFLGPGFKCRGR